MGVQENWIANLRRVVDTEAAGADKRAGYRAVSTATGLSEEYIYQLYEGKPKADGSPRPMGPKAAKAIARAYANGRPLDWIDNPPDESEVALEQAAPLVLDEALRSLGPEARQEVLDFIRFKITRSSAPHVQEMRARYLSVLDRLSDEDQEQASKPR